MRDSIFTSEDEMFAWLIEKGMDIIDCDSNNGKLIVEVFGDEINMNYRELEDGRVELI